MTNRLHAWKYVALLTALVGISVVEPLAVNLSPGVSLGLAAITLLVYLGVLLAIFENRWEQRASVFLIGGAFIASMSAMRSRLGTVASPKFFSSYVT